LKIFYNQSKLARVLFFKYLYQIIFIIYREVHIDSESDDQKSPRHQQISNRQSPFRDARSNGKSILLIKFILLIYKKLDRSTPHTDWLEKSMTQIDLFGRRHRGMLESIEHKKTQTFYLKMNFSLLSDEPIEEYFSNNTSKHENDNDEEQ